MYCQVRSCLLHLVISTTLILHPNGLGGGGGEGERDIYVCVFVVGESAQMAQQGALHHSSARSPNLSLPVALSLSSPPLVFSPSWTLNPAGGGVFSGISSRILHCCSNYLSTPNPNCISFFYIHIPL